MLCPLYSNDIALRLLETMTLFCSIHYWFPSVDYCHLFKRAMGLAIWLVIQL